jgi:hypothetical protein
VATEVIVTDQFRDWYRSLDDKDADAVEFSIGLLEQFGVALGAPHSSKIVGTALRELRIQSGGRPLRTFYAFDPKRRAVLLIGGDKTGDGRFYRKMIAEATVLWNDYLAGK